MHPIDAAVASPRYLHAEAYCLMTYEGTTSGRRVIIWNSRDGVTPFYTHIGGEEYKHVDWCRNNRPLPHYVPAVGDIIFLDLTLEKAREYRREYLKQRPGAQLADFSVEETVEHLAVEDFQDGHQPDQAVVTQEMHEVFKLRSECAKKTAREDELVRQLEDLEEQAVAINWRRERVVHELRVISPIKFSEITAPRARPKKTYPIPRKRRISAPGDRNG